MSDAASRFRVAEQSNRKNCDSRKDAKHVLSKGEGRAKLTGRGPSSRTNAKRSKKISLGVFPSLAEGVEMT